MLVLTLIVFHFHAAIVKTFEMSILQKLFKRKKTSGGSVSNLNTSNQSEGELQGLLGSPSNSKSSESDLSGQATSDSGRTLKLMQLKTGLRKLQKQNGRLRRRHIEVLALEAEVTQVLSLTALAKRHTAALDEEILNKKCELSFLKSELSSEETTRVKKHEPVYHKRYALLKNTTDAKKLLTEIRERLAVFQMLELMTYNKCLELKHSLSGPTNSKRIGVLLKNKSRHFDHLSDILRDRQSDAGVKSTTHTQNTGIQDIQCVRLLSPEISQATTAPPNGSISLMFPAVGLQPMSQQVNNANAFVPLAPPVPNMLETTI